MRTFLALLIFAGGALALNSTADARRYKRSADTSDNYYSVPRRVAECERARHEDPTGVYKAYPCWAREAFGRGTQGGGQGGRR